MTNKHRDTDKPETDEQALELLRFGSVLNPLGHAETTNYQRTERRMQACADYFERRIRELEQSDSESVAMYHRARDRADSAAKELESVRAQLNAVADERNRLVSDNAELLEGMEMIGWPCRTADLPKEYNELCKIIQALRDNDVTVSVPKAAWEYGVNRLRGLHGLRLEGEPKPINNEHFFKLLASPTMAPDAPAANGYEAMMKSKSSLNKKD